MVVPSSIRKAWEEFFDSLAGMKGRDYAVGYRRGDRKHLKRVAYMDLQHFLEEASNDWRRYGQYLSIHDFGSKLYNEFGQYAGVRYHISRESDVKPDALCHVYIDIEPKREVVDERRTRETLERLVEGAWNAFGARPLVMVTRPGRYCVLFPLPRVEIGEKDVGYARLLYETMWRELLKACGVEDEINVTIDPQVKDLARVTRVPYTMHEITRRLIEPIDVQSLRPVRARDFDLDAMVEPLPRSFVSMCERLAEEEIKRRIEMMEKVRRELAERRSKKGILPSNILPSRAILPQSILSNLATKKRCVDTPDLGRVCYDPRLEGWGWIKTIVKERIPIPDARQTLCWLTLPWSIKHGLISEEEALSYIRFAAEFFPDKDPEVYIDKMYRNMKYDYTAPTWRSLLTMVRKDGSPISDYNAHIRASILAALYWAGLVDIEKVEVLEEMLGTEIEQGLRARKRKRGDGER